MTKNDIHNEANIEVKPLKRKSNSKKIYISLIAIILVVCIVSLTVRLTESKDRKIIQVAAGTECALALKADGTLLESGKNTAGELSVEEWTDIVFVSMNSNFSVGLKSDGTVIYSGNLYNGIDASVLSDWTDIVDVSVSDGNHVVGLKSDGTVVACGENDYGQCDVSDWTDIVAIETDFYRTVGVKSDGTIVKTAEIGVKEPLDFTGWTDLV